MILKKIIDLIGIDQTVKFTLLSRFWTLTSGLLSLVLITKFLSIDSQGFYYTFFSIVAIQTLFELGLTYTITQLIAHEMAGLKINIDGVLDGSKREKARLASIAVQSTKWFLVATFIFIISAVIFGCIIFSKKYSTTVEVWMPPLILLIVFSGLKLFITSLEGVFEGVGHITIVAKTRMFSTIFGTIFLWGSLITENGLYGPASMTLASALYCIFKYKKSFKKLLLDILHTSSKEHKVEWKKEIWPLQWRMAISWGSGYFIYQTFNPIIFYILGAEDAGKFGMAMTIANVIVSIAAAWIFPKVAMVSTYTAQQKNIDLKSLFYKMISSAVLMALIFSIGSLFCYLIALKLGLSIVSRLPSIIVIIGILLGVILSQPVSVVALFVRAKKFDPYVKLSIISALMTIGCLYYFLPKIQLVGAALAYLMPTLIVGLPGSYILYKKYLKFEENNAIKN